MLSFNAVTVRLGGRTILDGVSASLPPRACIGLIGRNGAGKSTLMKAIAGQLEPDAGSIDMPRAARMGYIAQEAPSGQGTPFGTVLAADTERAALITEEDALAASGADGARLAEVHDRLVAIDAYTAPARAGRILDGLGFDAEAQQRPLDSFSGGWKMRVALAALLFSQPDLLLLDEPSNHLDLEAAMWLETFLKSYRGTILIISHERDLLNNVVDNILHLEQGKVTLYAGNYDSYERQRAERLAQLAAAREAQTAQRAKLQDYIARNSARASTAKQAQSRQKALAKMQPIAEAAVDPSLKFDFPSPPPLKPPLVQLDNASVGYDGLAILSGLDLRLDPDDRLALLGRNGNGKTTLARLLSGQLPAMTGSKHAPGKLRVGYFTQYQVEELDVDDTPLEHMTRLMRGSGQSAVRAQLGRFGFTGGMAEQKVGKMSGGERARLALALITRDAPHLLILDEPTNHLDVDTREALVQALNGYDGAVVVVSHDRHMIEASADRLVLVDAGRAVAFDGSLDDYTDSILGSAPAAAKAPAAKSAPREDPKEARRRAAAQREATAGLRKALKTAEAAIAAHTARLKDLDAALFDPKSAAPADANKTASALMQERGVAETDLAKAEAAWVKASEALEAAG
ncbi:ABC-F family ATP-binding cassette domain-containing protein [Sandarakinorhabdus sp.]|uniref:ABC-F family ATP-binding cassette domain-containing protein n=1 Tax=Sandarakinorhabdus sp. TaxID=1916663 RepID=UPI00286D736D|nr:ABC-F family ATP-binding cassette domain-containing protein [Sandarakinorhabdus sp.]